VFFYNDKAYESMVLAGNKLRGTARYKVEIIKVLPMVIGNTLIEVSTMGPIGNSA
jgi:hypothetical protein